jgi:rhodanese-related sulfurtransferase
MKISLALAALLGLAALAAQAQQPPAAAPAARAASAAPPPWRYKTTQLSRDQVDALLAKPEQLLVLDVRRPDELIRYGSFPVFLNIQSQEVESQLAYLPRDRAILTVSNHAQRAGLVGDLLTSKGFKVVGAAGAEDYELAGGKAVRKITPPPPRVAAASAPAAAR